MSDDNQISQRYRELPREEPPRHLDDAILAASRRAVDARPAPLVAPTGRRRWYFPLAAAAIIVLAVAVTMHVERERPDAELVVVEKPAQVEAPVAPSASREREAAKPVERPARKAAPPAPVFVPDPKPAAPPPAAAREGARDAAGALSQRLEEQ